MNIENIEVDESLPKIFVVTGRSYDHWPETELNKRKGLVGQKPWEAHFTVNTEFKTIEEAQLQVEKCKTWASIIPDSLEIKEQLPETAYKVVKK